MLTVFVLELNIIITSGMKKNSIFSLSFEMRKKWKIICAWRAHEYRWVTNLELIMIILCSNHLDIIILNLGKK